jgi:hypothetical protein
MVPLLHHEIARGYTAVELATIAMGLGNEAWHIPDCGDLVLLQQSEESVVLV